MRRCSGERWTFLIDPRWAFAEQENLSLVQFKKIPDFDIQVDTEDAGGAILNNFSGCDSILQAHNPHRHIGHTILRVGGIPSRPIAIIIPG